MSNKILGRLLLSVGLLLLIVLFAWEVFAEDLTVIEVRRNIPLSDKDPVFKDYYITAGSAQGLKRHQVVTAVRKINLKDPSGNSSYGEVNAPVGQLKIIAVGEKISVARSYKEISREDEPMLEQTAIMIGDKIDLKGSFVDNRPPPATKTIETLEPRPPAAPAAAATTLPPAPAAPVTAVNAPAEPETKASAPALPDSKTASLPETSEATE